MNTYYRVVETRTEMWFPVKVRETVIWEGSDMLDLVMQYGAMSLNGVDLLEHCPVNTKRGTIMFTYHFYRQDDGERWYECGDPRVRCTYCGGYHLLPTTSLEGDPNSLKSLARLLEDDRPFDGLCDYCGGCHDGTYCQIEKEDLVDYRHSLSPMEQEMFDDFMRGPGVIDLS